MLIIGIRFVFIIGEVLLNKLVSIYYPVSY